MSSSGEHASMGKGLCVYDGLKIHKIISKILEKKLLLRNFLGPKIFKKSLFLAIFGQKFDKSSEPAELNRRREVCYSAI